MTLDMHSGAVVIVGGGQGGFQVAASLRADKFQGAITIVSDEPGLPYQRPPLSKAYLLGKVTAADLHFRPEAFFVENRITLIHARAVAIDRMQRRLELADGRRLPFGQLVLATGSRNRPLAIPGADLGNIFNMKTLGDADVIGGALERARAVVVIGAGFIGLEFAAVARSLGKAVHVLELAERPMARAVTPETSAFFSAEHQGSGSTLNFGQQVTRIEGRAGMVQGVVLADGRTVPADLIVYGVGVVPNCELAEAAGLAIENGIAVDDQLRTDDPAISAIGDCASFQASDGRRRRIESVQNAADQARAVAARLTGNGMAYCALPWFWSDQYDLKLQMVGLADGHDMALTIGDVAARCFTRLLFRDGRLHATESVNRPTDFMIARKLLARQEGPTLTDAGRPDFDLRTWAMAKDRRP